MAVRKLPDPATTERALKLRAALGLRSPAGWHRFEDDSLAWYENLPAASRFPPHTILCLHDLGGGSREFTPLLRQRIAGTRLVFFDWPGHGRSRTGRGALELSLSLDRAAAVLESFLADQELVLPTIVASGFSAAVALHYAATRDRALRGLALVNPAGLLAKPAPFSEVPRSFFGKRRAPLTPARRQALRLAVVCPAFREMLAEAQGALAVQTGLLTAVLARLKTPALLALSPQSRSHQRSWLRLIDQTLAAAPQHRIAIFSGGFHPAWDEPERFAQTLTAFVQAQLPLSRHHHAWQLTAVDYPSRAMNLWRCVHPECESEQILREGENPNQAAVKD